MSEINSMPNAKMPFHQLTFWHFGGNTGELVLLINALSNSG